MELRSRRDYWNQAASEKRFQHQPRYDWLTAHVPGREILDFGCGYGRLPGDLATNGYLNVVGTDFSEGMLKNAAAHLGPGVRLVQTDGRTLPFRDRSFDAVLLFTVLTCMPDDGEQRELLAEIKRVLRPRGVVYISDLLLNSDARNISRYQQFAGEFGTLWCLQAARRRGCATPQRGMDSSIDRGVRSG